MGTKETVTIAIIVALLVVLTIIIVLLIRACERKPPPTLAVPLKVPEVSITANPNLGISPLDSQILIKGVDYDGYITAVAFQFSSSFYSINLTQATFMSTSTFSVQITSVMFEGKITSFVEFTTNYTFSTTLGDIFEIRGIVWNDDGVMASETTRVSALKNFPCSILLRFDYSGSLLVIEPFSQIRMFADVSDDKCGDFTTSVTGICVNKINFYWDVDGDGVFEASTSQPAYTSPYLNFGIYYPKVKMIDDAGNVCVSKNEVVMMVARRFANTPFDLSTKVRNVSLATLTSGTYVLVSADSRGSLIYKLEENAPDPLNLIEWRAREGIASTFSSIFSDAKKVAGRDIAYMSTGSSFNIYDASSGPSFQSSATLLGSFSDLYGIIGDEILELPNSSTWTCMWGDSVYLCEVYPSEQNWGIRKERCHQEALGIIPTSGDCIATSDNKIIFAYSSGAGGKVLVFDPSTKQSRSINISFEKIPYFVDLIEYSSHLFLFASEVEGLVEGDVVNSEVFELDITNFTYKKFTLGSFGVGDLLCPEVEFQNPILDIKDFVPYSCPEGLCLLTLLCYTSINPDIGTIRCILDAFSVFDASSLVSNFSKTSIKKHQGFDCYGSEGDLGIPTRSIRLYEPKKSNSYVAYRIGSNGFYVTNITGRGPAKPVANQIVTNSPEDITSFEKSGKKFVVVGGRGGIDMYNFEPSTEQFLSQTHFEVKLNQSDVLRDTDTVKSIWSDGSTLFALLGAGLTNYEGIYIYDINNINKIKLSKLVTPSTYGFSSILGYTSVSKYKGDYIFTVSGFSPLGTTATSKTMFMKFDGKSEPVKMSEVSFGPEYVPISVEIMEDSNGKLKSYVNLRSATSGMLSIIDIESGQILKQAIYDGIISLKKYKGYIVAIAGVIEDDYPKTKILIFDENLELKVSNSFRLGETSTNAYDLLPIQVSDEIYKTFTGGLDVIAVSYSKTFGSELAIGVAMFDLTGFFQRGSTSPTSILPVAFSTTAFAGGKTTYISDQGKTYLITTSPQELALFVSKIIK